MSRYDILCGRTPKHLDVIAPPAETKIYKARVKNISEGTEIRTGLGGLRAFFVGAMVYFCGKEIEIFPVKSIRRYLPYGSGPPTPVEGWWGQRVASTDPAPTTIFYYHESWLEFIDVGESP